jgi:hypothetical protein
MALNIILNQWYSWITKNKLIAQQLNILLELLKYTHFKKIIYVYS